MSQTIGQIQALIEQENQRQSDELTLIASENHAWPEVLAAMSSRLTDKYSEGYPSKRYYAGNRIIDQLEQVTIDLAKEVFGAEHANVQPLSGSPANLAIYFALLKPGDTILAPRLDHGGHLSHGHKVNVAAKIFNFVHYGVDPVTGLLDMAQVAQLTKLHEPKLIIAGFSAYPREIDWAAFRAIAKSVGALTLADISHTAGLIAAKAMASPIPHFDVVMTTTHKTLRGPRGAIILCRQNWAEAIDKAIFPGMQGEPHNHTIAAKAIALAKTLTPEFKDYAHQVIANAQTLAGELAGLGWPILTGGTDNHLLITKVIDRGLDGARAEQLLESVGINASRSTIPDDTNPPTRPSGLRLGTAAITARGMKTAEVKLLAKWIDNVWSQPDDANLRQTVQQAVSQLAAKFKIA